MNSQQYVIKRFDDEGQFQGYICINGIDINDNRVEHSLVPTLDEATKFELAENGNIVYECDGEKVVHDVIDFTMYTLEIPLSHLMVTVESEQE